MPGIRNITAPSPYRVSPEDAPAFWQLGNLWRVMASGPKTGHSFCLLDQLVTPKGGGPCTHAHPTDEGLYVVSGHCTFQAGGKTISAGAGDFVAVPRFAQHSFVVDAPDTQLLNFYLPSGFEMFVMGFSHPAERNELPPAGIPLAPRRLIEQLSRDYGQIPILGLPGADAPTAENMATEPLPEAAVQPFVSNAETSPAYWYEGGLWAILASGEATDGSYCLIEQVRVRGGATPPQVHLDTDVVFYVLDGEMTFLLDDRIETASKGDLVFIPRKSVYALRIDSGRARFLNLYTPSGFERILSNLGYPAITRELPPFEWRAPPVNSDQKSRLFADLGIRSIAVPNPIS